MTLREILLLDISRRVAANRPMGEVANSVLGAIEARVRRLEAADHTLVLLDGTLVVPVDEVRRVILGDSRRDLLRSRPDGRRPGDPYPPARRTSLGGPGLRLPGVPGRPSDVHGPMRSVRVVVPGRPPGANDLIRLGHWRIRGVRAKWKGITEEAIEASLADRPNTRIPFAHAHVRITWRCKVRRKRTTTIWSPG